MTNAMDRRHFFRALGTAGAAAAIATAGVNVAFGDEAASSARALGDADVNFSQEVDVLIVGAGISGMMAALDPATAGLKTLIVEQNGFFGGDAIYSAACMMCNTAKLTEEERPEKYTTIEELRERFAPYYENDEAGLDKLMQLQEWGGKFMDKLHYEWGYNFQPKMEGPYQQAFFPEGGICTLPGAFTLMDEKITEVGTEYLYETTYNFQPKMEGPYQQAFFPEGGICTLPGAFTLMDEKITEVGTEYLYETTLKTLIVDENGAVVGARFVDKTGAPVDIAAKAVILATGGYASNQEWMTKYAPSTADLGCIVSGRTGEGIKAGIAAGGTLFGMAEPGNLNPRHEAGHMLGMHYPVLVLLPNGKRFYCETAVHDAATGCLNNGFHEWWTIWDNTAQNGVDQEVIKHAGENVKVANSLEELAEGMGMHIETVQAAFDNYNQICDNGEDPDFGRALFLQKLEAPYYYLLNTPVRYKSSGGLNVSDRYEVLNADGNPIPGLYACGCTAGTTDIVPAAGSGMIVGQTVAEDLA